MSNTDITVVEAKLRSLEDSKKQFYVVLTNHSTKITSWFGTDSISSFRYGKMLEKGFKGTNTGFVTRLSLNGVGFKSDIIEGNILSLRIGKKDAITYELPDSIFATVSKNRVFFWGPNETVVDNFVQFILKKTPVKAGSLIYEKGLKEFSIND